MGYLYQPKLKSGGKSSLWWVKYYVNGRAVRQSTRTDDKDAAKRLLKTREGAAASGQPVMPRVDRIRAVERNTGRIIPSLFPYLRGRRRIGQRRRDFRKDLADGLHQGRGPGHARPRLPAHGGAEP